MLLHTQHLLRHFKDIDSTIIYRHSASLSSRLFVIYIQMTKRQIKMNTLKQRFDFHFPADYQFIDTIIRTSLYWSSFALFIVCVGLSWGSFVDYIKSFYKIIKD